MGAASGGLWQHVDGLAVASVIATLVLTRRPSRLGCRPARPQAIAARRRGGAPHLGDSVQFGAGRDTPCDLPSSASS
jgi:hypothetical protein